MALQQLEDRINRHLQDYLMVPAEERVAEQYMGLREQLSRSAQDFAKQTIDEARMRVREQKRGVGTR